MVADLAEVAVLKCILKAMTFIIIFQGISGHVYIMHNIYKADNIVWTPLVGH